MNIQSRVIPSWDVTREPEKYVPSNRTDIRKTFQQVRAKMAGILGSQLVASIAEAKAKRGNK